MAAPEQKDKPKHIEFYGGYEVYSESGVDLTVLRSNLHRPIEERWEKNGRALEFALALQRPSLSAKEVSPLLDKPSNTRAPLTLVKLLTAHRVQTVIVGVQAMHAHGSTFMTEEIDICYQRTQANLEALVAAITPLHPSLRDAPPELLFSFDVPTLVAGINFPLITDCGYINLLGVVSGIGTYDQVVAQSEEKMVYGLPVRILSVDGLIVAKKAAGRTKDQSDLRELFELKKTLETAKLVENDRSPESSP